MNLFFQITHLTSDCPAAVHTELKLEAIASDGDRDDFGILRVGNEDKVKFILWM